MRANFILKMKDFWRKNKTKIIIALLIWLVIVIINYILKNVNVEITPKTTYEPHTAIMDDSKVPEKLQNPIEELISKYINYCNNKEYENAYNMLSYDCKNQLYPNIEDFKTYIDSVFDEKKAYYIQDYSNEKDTYIYSVCIFEDMLATGLTGSEVEYYEEKFVIRNNNGNLELSTREYIGKQDVQNVYEDEYMKISIENMVQTYENQVYTVKITNRCEYPIVLANGSEAKEILLGLKNENRNVKDLPRGGIVIYENQTKTYELKFTKFFDENETAEKLIFNAVRVLNSYSGREELRQKELDNAVKLYSIEMELN